MGAMITVEYNDGLVSSSEAKALSDSARKIVIELTGIKDVFVYANSAQIKVEVSPVEIFIHVNAHSKRMRNINPDELVEKIAEKLIAWKKEDGFRHLLNVTVIPSDWHFKLDI